VGEGEIVAIEPEQSNQQILVSNVSLNSNSSVNIVQKAAGNERGKVHFNPATESVEPGSDGYEVSSQPIDELVSQHQEYFPTVAKIDVEGYERQVLEGMSETLSDNRCRLVYCEVHEPATHRPSAESYGGSHTDIQSILQNHGFKVETLERTGKEIHIKATK
jgi:FkbM family methyltransferase